MKKKQSLDLVITRKFSTFAQAYTGLTDKIEIVDTLFMGGYLWDTNLKHVPRQKMFQLWDDEKWVEIRFEYLRFKYPWNMWQINIDACGETLICDTYDAKELLDDIINFAFDE